MEFGEYIIGFSSDNDLKFWKSDYAVVEKPTLETWMQGGLDYIVLKTLNIDGIRTIGSVLGQSIALDYYIRQVHLKLSIRLWIVLGALMHTIFFLGWRNGSWVHRYQPLFGENRNLYHEK